MTEQASINWRWFLIHTNPRQEDRADTNLRCSSVETFSPHIREWHYDQFTGKRSPRIKPLFSRYVFARFDLQKSFHKVRYTRGVHELVTFGDGPAPVEDEVIDLIRSRVGSDGFVKIGTDLKPGDSVIVTDGPMKDFTGVFEREMKDSDRVLILLNTIGYQARLQVHRDRLRRCSDPS